MATTKEYKTFILEQLSDLEGIFCRGMMGEYILYFGNKIVGGIYDNRLLLKPTKTALAMLPADRLEQPYTGAKAMLRVDEVDDRAFLERLILSISTELPSGKQNRAQHK